MEFKSILRRYELKLSDLEFTVFATKCPTSTWVDRFSKQQPWECFFYDHDLSLKSSELLLRSLLRFRVPRMIQRRAPGWGALADFR